jgi:hypothetical protein
VCQAYDEVLRAARHRFWLAVPRVYSHGDDPWLNTFMQGVAALARRGADVRAYLRPSQNNAHPVALWRAAGARIVQDTPAVRYLHPKLLVADDVALSTSVNLIGVDLYRNVNQIAIERRPEDVARWAAFIESLEAPAEPEPDPTTTIWEPAAYRPAVTRVGVGRAAR